jgi:hypothetical protein
MPAHRHVDPNPPALTEAECDALRWEDDGGPVAEPGPDAERLDAEWLRISAELTGRFPTIGDRDDCIVTCEDPTRSGAPAAFYPTLAKVEVDKQVFAGRAPATIRPARFGDEDRYPAAWGAFCHEGAHAAYTRWTVNAAPAQRMTAAYAAADMLEESRAESRHLTRRPGDLKYLRSCATDLVLEGMGKEIPDNAWSAAFAAGLILARRDAGILEPGEVAELEDEVVKILGTGTLEALAEIWSAVHATADDDAEAMLEHGRAWCEAVGHDPKQPEPRESDDAQHLPGIPGGIPSAGTPTQGAPANGAGGAIAAAIGKTAANVNATEAAREVAEKAAQIAVARAADAKIRAKKAKASRARRAEDTAKAVFAPDAGTFTPGGKSGGVAPTPVIGTRMPTGREKAAAGKLARALRAAAYRERVETTTFSAAPPGRLNMRAAMARDAQRAAGATPTALPWTHTSRRATPAPPLRVGIAVDVSGSMGALAGPIASAAWILTKATSATDPDSRTATVAYDESLTAITRPGRAPERATEFVAQGGGHALGDAIDALDAALGLTSPGAGRLLIIASDGHYQPQETAAAAWRIKALTDSGCAVVQIAFKGGWYGAAEIPGATFLELEDPATAPDQIGKAATAAIAATR